jgi:hypothetical protein
MKRLHGLSTWISLGVLAAAAAPALAGPGAADLRREGLRPQLVPVPVHAGVEVWTDAGEGTPVRPGEFVDVYVRAERSSYIAVIDIDTRGRARLLYPTHPRDDGFVRGGRLVAIPGPHAEYRLAVTGPSGTERIVALSSDRPLVHSWREALAATEPYDHAGDAWGAAGYPARSLREERLEPRLVPVPVERCGNVERAETWFEVVRRARYRSPRF